MRAFVVALLTTGMYLLVGCSGQQQEQKAEEQKQEQVQPAEQPPAEPAQPADQSAGQPAQPEQQPQQAAPAQGGEKK